MEPSIWEHSIWIVKDYSSFGQGMLAGAFITTLFVLFTCAYMSRKYKKIKRKNENENY